MNQLEAADIIKDMIENDFFNVVKALTTQLGVPTQLVGSPNDELRVYVNGQRMFDFLFAGNYVSARKGSYANTDAVSNDSACYKPFLPGLMVSTKSLEKDAAAAGLSEKALLEILVLHEFAHVAMMGQFVRRDDASSQAWIKSEDLRYIHEAVALKACETAFADLYRVANKTDVENYLRYVNTQAGTSTQGHYYAPYFERFQNLPNDRFWQAISESTSFEWDGLLNPH